MFEAERGGKEARLSAGGRRLEARHAAWGCVPVLLRPCPVFVYVVMWERDEFCVRSWARRDDLDFVMMKGAWFVTGLLRLCVLQATTTHHPHLPHTLSMPQAIVPRAAIAQTHESPTSRLSCTPTKQGRIQALDDHTTAHHERLHVHDQWHNRDGATPKSASVAGAGKRVCLLLTTGDRGSPRRCSSSCPLLLLLPLLYFRARPTWTRCRTLTARWTPECGHAWTSSFWRRCRTLVSREGKQEEGGKRGE